MIHSRRLWLSSGLIVLISLAGVYFISRGPDAPPPGLPATLSDTEFWNLIESFSEPGGYFRSENFVSNESTYQTVIPDLLQRTPTGGVYIGVGPDQNFTYIAALEPRVAFVVDIRRQNMIEHLMYKALFEV